MSSVGAASESVDLTLRGVGLGVEPQVGPMITDVPFDRPRRWTVLERIVGSMAPASGQVEERS